MTTSAAAAALVFEEKIVEKRYLPAPNTGSEPMTISTIASRRVRVSIDFAMPVHITAAPNKPVMIATGQYSI